MDGKLVEWTHLTRNSHPKEEQWCLVFGERGYEVASWRRDERTQHDGFFIAQCYERQWNVQTAEYWMPLPKWPMIEKDKE